MLVKPSVDKALLKARSHLKRGETIEAEKLFKAILAAFPKNKKAKQGLASLKISLSSHNNQSAPQEIIEKLVNFYNNGQLELVIEKAQEITKNYPETFIVWNILGVAAARTQMLDQAVDAFQRATFIKPDYSEGYYNMGNALKDQGNLEQSVIAYKKAISFNSDYPAAFYNMGTAFKNQDKLEDAVKAFKKAIMLKPDYVEAHNNLGNVFQEQGSYREAINSYKEAISINQGYAKAYKNMAYALGEQGQSDEAIGLFEKALSLEPNYAEVHRQLSLLIKYQPNNPQMELVSQLLENPGLEDADRCHLNYAFAKMNEDLGNLGSAFENYVAGGVIRRKLMVYDQKHDELLFKKIKTTLPKLKQIDFNSYNETKNLTPIFILGMPRSGTTLVEQIISAHSQVNGAGELKFLGQLGGMIGLGKKAASQKKLLQVRECYLEKLNKLSNGKKIVTDKMPQNFLYLGLISIIFPEAKIIHVKRDPAATCWSNFKHYFSADGLEYSYILKDTVRYFKLYQDLMDFWHENLNIEIYDLNYDNLTNEQEIETKNLVNFLDIGWEDACLSPHSNKRSVRTASQLQVRKKVYKGSSDVWRKFEPYLDGIFDELPEL